MERESTSFELTYNVFRRKGRSELHCAVPQDRFVPTFLDGAFWEFAGTVRESASVRACFKRASALVGVRLLGFHLFQVTPLHESIGPDLAEAA
jgi:hypothetical protein